MRKYIVLLIIGIAIIGYIAFNQFESSNEQAEFDFKNSVKAAIGTKEDPEARIRYQQQRLRNPKTGKIPENIRQKELNFASTLPIRNSNYILPKADNTTEVVSLSTNWKLRGPHNVGGRTRALAIDITNDYTILAGGVSGGMWRSTDDGSTWSKTTDPDQLHSVTCIAQDTRTGHTNTWYFGTGEYSGNSASESGAFYVGDGIFKSNDNGQNWEVLPNTKSNSPHIFNIGFDVVWNLAIDPSNTSQDEIYAAVYNRIYRSTDGGNNWENVLSPPSTNLNSARYTDIAVTSTGVVYATLSSGDANIKGIFRSTDGISWTNITPTGWPAEYRRIVLSIAPSNENIVYFLAETPGSGTNEHSLWKYEYISGDGTGSGGSWIDRSANIPADGGQTGDFDSQGSYDLLIKVKPNGENIVFIGGINLYRSTDGFATTENTTWIGGYDTGNTTYANYPNHHADQHSLAFKYLNFNKVVSGHDGGLSYTQNILSTPVLWELLNNGYYTTQFYTCAIDYSASGDNLIIGGMQDNGTYSANSASSTASWNGLLSGDGSYCAIGEGYQYVSAQNGLIYRLGVSWTRVDPVDATDYLFIAPFILDRNNKKMMYLAAGSSIWRNSDLTDASIPNNNSDPISINWIELTNSSIATGDISTLDVSTTSANRLYYGTSEGEVYRLDGSNSGNPTPVNITSGSFQGGYISCVAVNPEDADEAVVVFSNYEVISLWHTSNAGSSWENISGNLEQNPDGSGNGPSVRWAEILPTDLGSIYLVGTSTGLYSNTNLNGATTVWAMEGATSIGNVVVDMIDSRTTDDLVVVATHGNGMYSSNVVVSINENPRNIVSNFKLKQNYPNPFNPTTTIDYEIPESTPVTLKIYNIQGKEIATLVNSDHTPGNYSVNWNGQDRFGRPVASGTYIYQIKAGKHRESKQMVLMR